MEDPGALRHRVLTAYSALLRVRRVEPAFHPFAPQDLLLLHPSVFALLRTARDGSSRVLCLHSVSNRAQQVEVSSDELGTSTRTWCDLVTGAEHAADGRLTVDVGSYGVCWLKASET